MFLCFSGIRFLKGVIIIVIIRRGNIITRRIKYSESAFNMGMASPDVDGPAALLDIANLIRKMRERAQATSPQNVENAVLHLNIATLICEQRPLFSNCYVTFPTKPITACNVGG